MILRIAKAKLPGRTKSEICTETNKLIVVLGFGVKINGKAKWKIPKIKMNNDSTVPTSNAFTFSFPLTFFNQNNLSIIRWPILI
jgi:hypothetical protein